MVAKRGENNPARIRQRPGFHQYVGPETLVAVESLRAGAVGIDGPQALHPHDLFIGIFPAGIKDPAVRQQSRSKIGFVAGTGDVDVLAVFIAAGQNTGGVIRPAPDKRIGPVGQEHVSAIGQIYRV